jgi:hypothetical protein
MIAGGPVHPVIAGATKQSSAGSNGALDGFVAAAKRQFILSAAAGGVEGLRARTDPGPAKRSA